MSYNKMMQIKAAHAHIPYRNVWIKLIFALERHSEASAANKMIKCRNKSKKTKKTSELLRVCMHMCVCVSRKTIHTPKLKRCNTVTLGAEGARPM